ncbi:MAG: nitroreductase family protein [Spirochaetaceae bacterium]
MELYEAIRRRKSVRQYEESPVPDEVLNRVLEAARLAPSAKNLQEWRFVVTRDPEARRRLAEAASGQRFVAEAPVVIACCAETNHRRMRCGLESYIIDVAIAVDHLTLAAAAEGLGTCWIGSFDPDAVRSILGIPRDVEVVELLPVGYPRDPSAVSKRRLPLTDIVHYERW